MTEYITKQDAELVLRQFKKGFRRTDEICAVNGCILEIQDMDSVDVISKGVYDQVRWERDVAIGQLESYGIGLGEQADAAKVVHGRWIHKGAWHIECSECKHILAHIGEAKNYRPNCGAKMDGDGNA